MQYKFDSLRLAKSDSVMMFEKKADELEGKLKRLLAVKDSVVNYERINEAQQELAQTKSILDNISTRRVKSEWKLIFGLVVAPSADLDAKKTEIVNSFRYASYALPSLGSIYLDTASSRQTKGDIRLPLSIGFGTSMVKGTKWLIGADFNYQQWSEFRFMNVSDSLEDSWRVNVGAQFVPNDRASKKQYQKWMSYRIGAFYQKGYIVLHDQTINDIGFTAGLALPIRNSGTQIHISAMAGQRGTTKNDLIRERYIRLTFGLTINDRWFKPTKYE
jgi:hypothetical protein